MFSAKEALSAEKEDLKEVAYALFGKASTALAKAKVFGSDLVQQSVERLAATYQARIQDLTGSPTKYSKLIPASKPKVNEIPDMEILEALPLLEEEQPTNCLLNHIAGLGRAKQILLEALILPRKFPYLYSKIKPWNKLLLYGVSHS